MKTEIIFEDKDILVVRKPGGLATQTAKVGTPDVVSECKNYLHQGYLGVIHRLDQPVEGLLVFAKNKSAAAVLTAQLRQTAELGGFQKHYYGVLCGQPVKKQDSFVDYLDKDKNNRALVGKEGEGKRAVLHYRIIREIERPMSLALADIVIETGRFHQIRAQMAHHGLPLLGDVKYGTAAAREGKALALCAYKLEFIHPVTKKTMSFETRPRGSGFSFFSQI